jgi:hypothetical protein
MAAFLFIEGDGYQIEDKCGAFRGYRPYWMADYFNVNARDPRLWTCWDRAGGLEIWPAVVDDYGTLRTSRATRIVGQQIGGEA